MTTIYKCCHGQTIRPGKAWTDGDGVTHPASWHTYSAGRKAELGITEIVQQPAPDSRLYTWSYNDDGTVASTAKSLDDVPLTDGTGQALVDADGNPRLDINGQPLIDGTGDPILDDNGDQIIQPGVKIKLDCRS